MLKTITVILNSFFSINNYSLAHFTLDLTIACVRFQQTPVEQGTTIVFGVCVILTADGTLKMVSASDTLQGKSI